MPETPINRASLLVGLASITGAGLYLVDASGAARVDDAVTVASLVLVLGATGLIRSVQKLVRRERG